MISFPFWKKKRESKALSLESSTYPHMYGMYPPIQQSPSTTCFFSTPFFSTTIRFFMLFPPFLE